MTGHRTIFAILFASTVFATPSFANYFHNHDLNIHANVGSAPNPTARDLRDNRVHPGVAHNQKKTQPVVAQSDKGKERS